jgi:pilus assembly protein FimV
VAEEAAPEAAAEPEAATGLEMEPAQAADEPEGLGAITLDFPGADEEQAAEEKAGASKEAALDLSDISLDLGTPAPEPAAAPAEDVKDARWHDVATKLDLARAYQEMGDASGAREILEEVLKEGDAQQQAMAKAMIQQLS